MGSNVEINEIYLENMTLDVNTRTWNATIYLDILDHFGLDDADLSGWNLWRRGIMGFAAWWVLQKKRDYVPFRSELRVKASINGIY